MSKRIAVVISGEYRTFDMAVKTMPFLQADNVDIYFSTWNMSVQVNVDLDVNITEHITVEKIERAIAPKKLTGCNIQPRSKYDFAKCRYNTQMIDRWKWGLTLVKNSKVEYDVIMLMRPDLGFRQIYNPDYFTSLDQFLDMPDDIIMTAWNQEGKEPRMDDVLFIGKAKSMMDTILSISIHEWNRSDDYDWHRWLYNEFQRQARVTKRTFPHVVVVFCRGTVVEGDDYDQMRIKSVLWRNNQVENLRKERGDEYTKEVWGQNILEELKKPVV